MLTGVLRALKGNKKLVAGIALLIGACALVFFAFFEPNGGGSAFIKEAWRASFGLQKGSGLAADVILGSSSTMDMEIGLEEVLEADGFSWPSLLIEEKVAGAGSGSFAKTAQPDGPVGPPLVIGAKGRPAAASPVPAEPRWCDLSGTGRSDAKVILNEVAWMGSTQGPNDEWLELANVSGSGVGLTGWQVQSESGNIKINFGAGSDLPKDDFFLLRRSAAGSENSGQGARLELGYSGALRNTGDRLKLFNAECRIVDEVDASGGWPAGDNTKKKTMERDADGSGWHDSEAVDGSPRAKNSVPPAPPPIAEDQNEDGQQNSNDDGEEMTEEEEEEEEHGQISDPGPEENSAENSSSTDPTAASTTATSTEPAGLPGHLVIAEIQITGGVGSSTEDHVKIYNPTGETVDVSGWKLRKRAKTGTESSIRVFGEGSVVAPGGHFIWANSGSGFAASIGAHASSTQTLAGDNSAALLDAAGVLIDAVAWGGDHTDPFAEGQVYPENPEEGQVLRRRSIDGSFQDTDNNAMDFQAIPP